MKNYGLDLIFYPNELIEYKDDEYFSGLVKIIEKKDFYGYDRIRLIIDRYDGLPYIRTTIYYNYSCELSVKYDLYNDKFDISVNMESRNDQRFNSMICDLQVELCDYLSWLADKIDNSNKFIRERIKEIKWSGLFPPPDVY